MKIIEVPGKTMARKAFVLDDNENYLLDFKPEIEVLPAMYAETDSAVVDKFYFIKRHEPGEPCWKEGGYEVVDSHGASRSFYLDALIVHPKVFVKRAKSLYKPQTIVDGVLTDKPKGKRGRPKKDPTLCTTKPYVPTGGRRGRPCKDPSQLVTPKQYVPTGGKRGRKPLDPEIKAQREAEKAKLALLPKRKRGRPSKNNTI